MEENSAKEQHKNLLKLLQLCMKGNELAVLHNTLLPEPYTLWLKCMHVKRDITNALFPFYPTVNVQVFGSTVMGTAFKDSDFDFFVILPPGPSGISATKYIQHTVELLRQSRQFTNFSPVPNARVPCLKCYHINTEYKCDIVFSESYGVFNSVIMAHLLNFDPRIHVLVMIIKYWMKINSFVGPDKISNYAILWLIIFFLQSTSVPIMPPIQIFQHNMMPYLVNGYNFAFNRFLPQTTKNCQRIWELLSGFFRFYKDFNFEKFIICPLYGKAYPKHNLLDNYPQEFARYKLLRLLNPNDDCFQLNKFICIQDPFKLTQTLSCRFDEKEYNRFRDRLKYTSETIEKNLMESGEEKKLLMDLLKECDS